MTLRRAPLARPKANKYGAKRTTVNGISFDSKAEARRYRELVLAQAAGRITQLRLQPSFLLNCGGKPIKIRSKGYPEGRRARYVADFSYVEVETGQVVVEDTKGVLTPVFKLKQAIVEAEYGIRVRVVR